MAAKRKALATIWELPDPLWRAIEPLLWEDAPPKATGRPRFDMLPHRGKVGDFP